MALAQSAKATTTGATSVATSAANFTSANYLLVMAACPSAQTITLADSSSNTWTAMTGSPKTVNAAIKLYTWYCANPTVGASQTFTATLSGSDIGIIAVIGLSGRANVAPEAMVYAADGSSVTSHTGGATTSQAASGDDIVVLFSDDEGVSGGRSLTYTAGTGFTMPAGLVNQDGRFTMTGGIEYQLNVGTGAITSTWTTSSANTGAAYIASIKSSSGPSVAVLTANNYRRRRVNHI